MSKKQINKAKKYFCPNVTAEQIEDNQAKLDMEEIKHNTLLLLSNYEESYKNLLEEFVRVYYTEDGYTPYVDITLSPKGMHPWPICIGEVPDFRDIENIYEALKNNFPKDIVMKRHSYQLDCIMEHRKTEINFTNYCRHAYLREKTEDIQEERKKK